MDHREFLRTLPLDERQRLNARSDAVGLIHLAAHWGLILCVGSLIVLKVPGWQVLVPVQGILIVFLFTLLHETCHMTPFETARLNSVVGKVCGFLLFLPPTWFRYFHFAHHRHTQDPDLDPELAEAKPETWSEYIVHVSGIPVLFGQVKTLVRNALGLCDDSFVPQQRWGAIATEARLMLALYAAVAVVGIAWNVSEILAVWIVPMLLGQPFLRLYLLAEHGRCPQVANMFENTRTTFTNSIIRKLAWNMPYHAEHHACPTVPFHRLPELHRLTQPHLRETEDGYGRFQSKFVSELSR